MSESRKRLPGSEKLTRPEDIKALSKYLGNIKKIQEEHTSLEKDNLEVPGVTTGFLPNITSLPDSAVGLEAGGDVSSLDTTSIGLDVEKETELSDFIETLDTNSEINLEEKRVNLEGNQKEVELSETKVELSNTENELDLSEERVNLENATSDQLNLSEFKETLEVEKDQALEESRVDLEVTDNIGLSSTRIDLEPNNEVNLDATRINLEDTEDIDLNSTRINLENIKEVELDTTKINLEDTEDVDLNSTRINLENIKEVELDTTRVKLGGVSESEDAIDLESVKIDLNGVEVELGEEAGTTDTELENLDSTRIDLTDTKEVELDNTLVDLETLDTVKLSDYRINLDNIKDVDLNNTRVELEDTTDLKLDNTRVELESTEDIDLSTTRLDIAINSDADLDSTQIKLEDERETELSDVQINLENTKESELNDTIIFLEVEDDTELESTKLVLDGIKETDLSNKIINLESNGEIEELSSERLDIEPKEDIDLGDKLIELDTEDSIELENTRVDLEGVEEINLSDYLDELVTEGSESLSDTLIKGPEKSEVDKLYETVLAGPEKVENDLSNTKIELTTEDAVSDLYDKTSRVVKPTSDPKINENGEAIEEWNGKELYDSLLAAPDDDKYQKILEMAAEMGNWGAKVAALTSAVLSGTDPISSERAAWYDAELKKLLYQMGALTVAHNIKTGTSWTNNKAEDLSNDLNSGGINSEDGNPIPENEILNKYTDEKNLPTHNVKAGIDGTYNDKAEKLAEDLTSGGINPEDGNPIPENEILSKYNDEKNLPEYDNDLAEKLDRSDDPEQERIFNELRIKESLTKDDLESPSKTLMKVAADRGSLMYDDTVNIPKYKLSSRGILDALNINNYIRFLAEKIFETWDPKTRIERKIRGILLDNTLALMVIAREQLERVTKANRDRLPGDDAGLLSDLVSGGVSGAVGNLVGNVKSAIQNTFAGVRGIDKTNPLNRPKVKWGLTTDGQFGAEKVKQPTENFDLGNDRDEVIEENGLGKNLGQNLVNALIGNLADSKLDKNKISFKERYIEGSTGMAITLMDLCNIDSSQKNELGSVEQLQELLKQSPYITTPGKFGTSELGKYKTMTLDTNAYWEVTIEPFCHYAMNGGYSFLPAIQEINWQNAITHGSWEHGDKRRTVTSYQKWVPIIGFELEKSRLTTKSLGLYDGEINYPVSSELTNELRMTIADDQYKSWRNYFQKCADVAVYSSEAHDQTYYLNLDYYDAIDNFEGKGGLVDGKGVPTVVDKARIAVASYKNIAFRVKIYIMTPQYSTIRRFDLLCVLKDFQESYSGDIDAGGYDLTVSFSIVGENPPIEGETDGGFDSALKSATKELRKTALSEGTKTVNKSSSLIKLL